ncbi:hypothetical protein CBL_01989 [Carabus blaptoides fortunei]
MDIFYVLLNNTGSFLMIVIATVVWRVLKQNETMKRERDLMEFNMIQQEKKYEMVLSRAMNENRELRNSTRELLNDIQTERKRIAQLQRMIEFTQTENRREEARVDNSRRGQRSGKETKTGKKDFDLNKSLAKANTVLSTVASVIVIGMQNYQKANEYSAQWLVTPHANHKDRHSMCSRDEQEREIKEDLFLSLFLKFIRQKELFRKKLKMGREHRQCYIFC